MAKQILGKVAYVSKGTYNNELFYEVNDVVTYNGSSYVALGNTLGNLPTDTSYWQLLAQKGDTYTVSEEDLNTIKQEIVDDANNDFNQNVNSKTEEFDTHVETKTAEFDTHVQEKTDEFDTNAAKYDERITQNTEDIAYNFARTNKNFQDSLEYKGAWGNDITFEDSVEFPLGELEMTGNSEQITTTGINLIGVEDFEENTKDGLTVSAKNGIITLNGKSTLESGYPALCNLLFNIPKETDNYTFKINILSGNKNGLLGIRGKSSVSQIWMIQTATTSNILTQELTSEKISNTIKIELYTSTLWTFDNLKFTIQLTKGTKDLQYEPYTGGQPSPSPDYSQEINSIEGDLEFYNHGSDNIFDGILEIGTINSLTGLEEPYSTAMRSKNYINVINNRKIYVISEEANTFGIRYYDEYHNYLGRSSYSSLSNFSINLDKIRVVDKTPYYKSNENITYIKFIVTTSTDTNLKIAFNAKENIYVPYKGRTLTIPTNGQIFRKIEDVSDKLIIDMKTGDYYKEENIDYYNFTGNENYILSGNATEELLVIAIPNNPPFKINNKNLICNRFILSSIGKIGTMNVYNLNSNGLYTSFRFTLDRIKYPNLEDGINYLKENNTYINFLKVTPTLEKIGTLTKEQLDTLVTFKGYNNIMINTNMGQANIDIKYVFDIRNYYNNIIYTNTVKGNDIIINNGLESLLNKIKIEGNSNQFKTEGINLIGLGEKANGYVNTSTNLFGYNPTAIGYSFATADLPDTVTINADGGNRSYISYFNEQINSKVEAQKVDRTSTSLPKTINLDKSYPYIHIQLSYGTTDVNNIMLNEGEEALQYEPYTGAEPSPNTDYPQEITSIEGNLKYLCSNSYNLITINNTKRTVNGVTFTPNEDGTITVNGTSTDTATYNLLENTTLTTCPIQIFSGDYILSDGVGDYTNYFTQLRNISNDGQYIYMNTGQPTSKKKLENGLFGVWIFIRSGVTLNNVVFKPMLIKGVKELNFEKNEGNKILNIPLWEEKLRKVKDISDKLIIDMKTGDCYKEKNIGEKIFNGSENWTLQSINEYGIANFGYQHNLNAKYGVANCNYFIHTNEVIADAKTCGMLWQNYYVYLRIEKEKASTVEEFKQWLSEHNVVINYQLNDPTIEKIGRLSSTDLNKLEIFKEYNNINMITNLGQTDIEVEYVLDIKKYIDEKVAEISEQLI